MKDRHQESFKRLQHILDAIKSIQRYVNNETVNSFCRNGLIHDAVLFQFSVIGKAMNTVESEKLDKYPYPWYKVRSFRNFIAHEHFNIKLSAARIIIERDLPELQATITAIMGNEF